MVHQSGHPLDGSLRPLEGVFLCQSVQARKRFFLCPLGLKRKGEILKPCGPPTQNDDFRAQNDIYIKGCHPGLDPGSPTFAVI